MKRTMVDGEHPTKDGSNLWNPLSATGIPAKIGARDVFSTNKQTPTGLKICLAS